MSRFILHRLIIAFIILMEQTVFAQENDIEKEIELGILNFQNAQFEQTLMHLEPIVQVIPENDSWNDLAILIFLCESSATAIEDFEKVILYGEILQNINDLPIEYKIQNLCHLLGAYDALAQETKCILTIDQLKETFTSYKSIDILDAITSYHLLHHNYTEIVCFEDDLKFINTSQNKSELNSIADKIAWNSIYMGLGQSFMQLENYHKAILYFNKSLTTIIPAIEGNRSGIYHNLARAYQEIGDKKTALKYQKLAQINNYEPKAAISDSTSSFNVEKFIESCQQNTSKNNNPQEKTIFQANKSLSLGILYIENEQYLESIDYLEEAAKLFTSVDDYDNYAYTLTLLYTSYFSIGNYDKYNPIIKLLEDIERNHNFKDIEKHLIVSSKIVDIHKNRGNYTKALSLCSKNIEEAEYLYSGKKNLYPYYYKMISLCIKMGLNCDANKYMERMRRLVNQNSDYYSVARNEYYSFLLLECQILIEEGQLGTAISKLENIYLEIEKEDNLWETRGSLFNTLGYIYSSIGNTDKSLEYSIRAIEEYKNNNGIQSLDYARGLINISENYAVIGDSQKALESIIEANNIIETNYGKNNPLYYTCLEKLADRYRVIDNEKSKELYQECISICKDLYGEVSDEYAECLVSCFDIFAEPYENGISVLSRAIDIKRKCGKNKDDFYFSKLSWLAILYHLENKWRQVYEISNELLEGVRLYLISNFMHLSGTQRECMWKEVNKSLIHIESMAAQYSQYAVEKTDYTLMDQFGFLAYDARLLKKGLLLTSSQKLSSLIENSDDPQVPAILNKIETIKSSYEELKTNDTSQREQLDIEINNNERLLVNLVSKNNEFIDFTNLHWQDIQNILMPGEVAIEFYSYRTHNTIQYAAVILSEGSKPFTFPLFCEFELDKFTNGDESLHDYNNPDLYNIIWGILETFSEVRNAHTIYFSADNILNTIAIENFIDQDGIRANEKWHLFRLSSTRELINKNPEDLIKPSTVLYGGLNYDAPLESLTEISYPKSSSETSFKNKQYNHTRSSRGTYEDLPGTLDEINNISLIMKDSQPELRFGTRGTESSFINLNGHSPSILHLATHGFFYEPEEIEDRISEDPTKYRFLNISNTKEISTETQAMRGSGLLFSGANTTLRGENIPDSLPDGILTAEELSNLNLSKTKLVVLSACETGLGKSTEEGVFGLQRGFKLAGVKSMLMSLWKVDDKATSQMMQYFYENLAKGLHKTEALQEAQKKMSDNPATSQPYYWAGWILLDALN